MAIRGMYTLSDRISSDLCYLDLHNETEYAFSQLPHAHLRCTGVEITPLPGESVDERELRSCFKGLAQKRVSVHEGPVSGVGKLTTYY